MKPYFYYIQALSLFIWLEYYENDKDLEVVQQYRNKVENNLEEHDWKMIQDINPSCNIQLQYEI